MKLSHIVIPALAIAMLPGCSRPSLTIPETTLAKVEEMSLDLARQGFNAGSSYSETWIRDYNTFIELSMDVMPDSLVRRNLDVFYAFQGEDGNIPDGFVPRDSTDVDYHFRYSDLEPGYIAHKNTVETDQESSLVQAVYKYVSKSGNKAYLQEDQYGETVYAHLVKAMEYLVNCKTDPQYGLLTGATTADWGDVQPESPWGVEIDSLSHFCIDVYDNAMFVLALRDMEEMAPDKAESRRWSKLADETTERCRKYLWDSEKMKFRPHLYLKDSPFPADFDEDATFIQGGTAVAILAGMLTRKEIEASLAHMLECQKLAEAQTIGITLYPPYPEGYFMNQGMGPYSYQNGGDWTWFGARMVHALLKYGMVDEAQEILTPMLDRVIANEGFNEWYLPSGEPMGSGTFRGEAGVLYTSIQMLRQAVR